MRASLLGILLIHSSLVGAAFGQSVRGRVLALDSNAPIEGATIVVRDDRGAVVGRVASREDGRYSMQLPRPGRYELQSMRIGFSPVRHTLGDLERGEERMLTVVMTEQPLQLAGVEVQGNDRCRMSRGDRERFVELWQEARAALGPHVSEMGGALAVRTVTVEGVEDGPLRLPGGRLVWNPEERYPNVDSTTARESYTEPFLARTPFATLAAIGYVHRREDGSWVHEVPNPEVILSEEFLATYCFGLDGGPPGHGNWVGLTFRPSVDSDSVTDIDGTLWVDKASAALRRVDFSYRNLPRVPFTSCLSKNRPARSVRGENRFGPYCIEPYAGGWRPWPPLGTGGTLEFAVTGSGVWVVSRWTIRMRGEEFMDRYAGYSTRVENGRAVRCNDRPSACTRVIVAVPRLLVHSGGIATISSDSVELYRGEAALAALERIATMQAGQRASRITGVVTDTEGRPVPGALVTIERPARAVRTIAEGRFEIRTLPSGEFTLRIAHEGHVSQTVLVSLKPNTTEELAITLRLPPPMDLP